MSADSAFSTMSLIAFGILAFFTRGAITIDDLPWQLDRKTRLPSYAAFGDIVRTFETVPGLRDARTALAFAITYNVGDVHVFLLPSHLFVVLAAERLGLRHERQGVEADVALPGVHAGVAVLGGPHQRQVQRRPHRSTAARKTGSPS